MPPACSALLSTILITFAQFPFLPWASPTAVRRATSVNDTSSCRYLPGDARWPSGFEWASLNTTVGGRLIATVPLGSPCHDPDYDEEECTALKAGWPFMQTQ
jgi:hypothetical protein